MHQILIKKDPEELIETAAALFTGIANNTIAARGSFSVALSGGSTPRALYSLLASQKYRSAIDWAKTRFFFSDERNVPPESAESNFRMANETLLEPLKVAEATVFRWKTELDSAERVASDYQAKLRPVAPLDLILLGLGSDAHTASLFPHTAALHETEKLAVTNHVPHLKDDRFTMTFRAINEARNIIVIVVGHEKARAVKNVLEGEFRPDDFPGQRIEPSTGSLYWLLDEPAASLLRTERGLLFGSAET
ncbi:MAG TPA: 6-phosphogluconolactonase [Pyrinomonadaceae bacterium]